MTKKIFLWLLAILVSILLLFMLIWQSAESRLVVDSQAQRSESYSPFGDNKSLVTGSPPNRTPDEVKYGERLAMFDLDGDCKLNEEERAANAADMEAIVAAAGIAGMKEDEGKLESVLTAEEEEEKERARWLSHISSGDGQRAIYPFDLDKDGVLNEDEKAAYLKNQADRAAEKEQDRVDQYDLDGDGDLSASEHRNWALTQQEENRARRQESRKDVLSRFDTNQDGRISGAESDVVYEYQLLEEFLNGYVQLYSDYVFPGFDTNRNGRIDHGEYGAFFEMYRARSPYADVDFNGVVDRQDFTRFIDYMDKANE